MDSPSSNPKQPASMDVTRILVAAVEGDSSAASRLFPLVYDELRAMARGYLRQERIDHTLQATALVNEAYLKLIKPDEMQFDGRAHFFGVAARAMRQILVNHAKSHGRKKRGGGRQRVEMADEFTPGADTDIDLVALDEALEKLAAFDESKARLVELRFFGGLSMEEVAGILGVSDRTLRREWSFTKSWLRAEMDRESAADEASP